MRILLKSFLAVVLLLSALGAGLWWWSNQPLPLRNSPLDFRVTAGSSLRAAVSQMREAGI
ncbi:MAG: mltG, partial [Proteobacteria bacterium]|nr:mltG [Pseudomonadota bacterium]